MIDPINTRDYYEYRKVNTEMGTATNSGEKFVLNQDSTQKESDKEKKKAVEEADGVVVEISNQQAGKQGRDGDVREKGKGAGAPTDSGRTASDIRVFLRRLSELFGNFVAGIKQALYEFWHSDSGADGTSADAVEGEVQEGVISEEEETVAEAGYVEEADGSETIAPVQEMAVYNESGQMLVPALARPIETEEERRKRIQEYLDQVAPGTYVKNSDLLTYYDRSGKIVKLNGADKNRILNGDKQDRRFMR